jgi:KaiC/GvpD/RAD55 family RecA-like ATPase
MIGTGIDQGGSVIYVTSRDPPRSLRTLIRSSGMDPERLEEAGRLRIVDWFSWRGERIIGVERDGYALKSSKILSNLSIAIGKAIKEVRFSNIQIAIVQIISSAINIFDLPQVYNFIMKLRAKFKDEGISTVFLLEKESIGPEDLSKIREAFDGILELNRNETPKAIERDMVVHSMAGVDFDHRPVPMTIANGRLIAITSPSEPVDGNEVPSGQAAEAKVAKVVAGTRSRRSSTARQLAEDRLKVTGTNVVIVPPVQDATPVLPEDGEGGPVSDERTVILAPPVRMRPKMKRITVKRSTSGTKERRGGPPRPPERMIAEALSTIDDLLDTDTLDKAPAVRPKRVRKKI